VTYMRLSRLILLLLAVVATPVTHVTHAQSIERDATTAKALLDWQQLPDLPDELGVAGPFVGVHKDTLIVAGGANFPRPVWDNDKVWHDRIHVLAKMGGTYSWKDGGALPRVIAYGATVSTPDGIVCMGGNDATETFREVFVLRWNHEKQTVDRTDYPPLPQSCAYGQATLIGDVIYLAGGQSGSSLDSAMKNFWSLDLSKKSEPDQLAWQRLKAWPGEARAFNITASQHNGYNDCVYVMSGRTQSGEEVQFLKDVWQFTPKTRLWRRRADVPRCVMAGEGIGFGQSHIFVLGGAAFHQSRRTEGQPSGLSQGGSFLSHDHRHLDFGRPDAAKPCHDFCRDVERSHHHCQRRSPTACANASGLECCPCRSAARFWNDQLLRAV